MANDFASSHFLAQQQAVNGVLVISRQTLQNAESMPFIEGDGRQVIHRNFQKNGLALRGFEALLGGTHQVGAESAAAALGMNVNGEDVRSLVPFDAADEKAGNLFLS